jgi:hypothetical protein
MGQNMLLVDTVTNREDEVHKLCSRGAVRIRALRLGAPTF